MTDTPKTLLEAVRYFARRPTIKPETSEMAKINFDVPHLCPNCNEPMQVLMPIWITPGSESVDTGNIDYESNNPQDSGNWFCENCESHHFPIGLDEDNAGCDDCGIHDRVPGSKYCAECGSLDSAVRSVVDGESELIGKRCWFNYPEEFTSLPQYSERRGFECVVLRQDLERIFLVRFEDFTELHVFESELDPIITEQRVDAKITELIRDVKDGDCALSAIFDDGSTRKLFNFYIDELAFVDCDLLGKTQSEAIELKRARDENYLRS